MFPLYPFAPTASPMMPGTLFSMLDTRTVYKVLAVGMRDGERFYFLTRLEHLGSIGLYPASMVEAGFPS